MHIVIQRTVRLLDTNYGENITIRGQLYGVTAAQLYDYYSFALVRIQMRPSIFHFITLYSRA